MVGVVVFDLDDTLMLERLYVASGFRAVSQLIAEHTSLLHDDCFESLWDLFESGVRGDTFDRFLAAHAFSSEHISVLDLVATYRSHQPDIDLPFEVHQLLEWLRTSCGAGLAIITDGPPVAQRNKIEALKLDDLVDHVVVTGELAPGLAKPHPAAFARIQEQWPYVTSDRFVYVGDNPVKDFQAPNKLGWMTVRLRQAGQLHRAVDPATPEAAADITIARLDELESLVDYWWSNGA